MTHEHLDRLERWWASTPQAQRHALYRPRTLADAAGIPVQSLPLITALAGWTRAARWLIGSDGRRKYRTFYAPPGAQVPSSAPRGRPETSIYTILNRRPPSPFDVAEELMPGWSANWGTSPGYPFDVPSNM